jgi:glutathione S-transferase
VLDGHLKAQPKGADGPWLVGGKYSFADMSFVPWQNYAYGFKDVIDLSEYTAVADWMERMKARPAVKKVLDDA